MNTGGGSEPEGHGASCRHARLHVLVASDRVIGPGGELPLRTDDPLVRNFLLLLLGEVGGNTARDSLSIFGYRSRATYYEKLKRYLKGGMAALLPERPGPRRKWRRSDEVVRAIVALKYHHPELAPEKLAEILRERGLSVSPRSVQRTLSEFGLVQKRGA